MALEDMLGKSSEIVIFDFLASNSGCAYTISEISDFTDLSRTTVHNKLPLLILNKLVEIDGIAGHVKTYRLARNELVTSLVTAVFQNSFMMADVDDEDKTLDEIKSKIDRQPEYSENRYYNPVTDGPLDNGSSTTGACGQDDRRAGSERSDAA